MCLLLKTLQDIRVHALKNEKDRDRTQWLIEEFGEYMFSRISGTKSDPMDESVDLFLVTFLVMMEEWKGNYPAALSYMKRKHESRCLECQKE